MYCKVLNDVASGSREQRLITKEHIATHANLILLFKPALYSSTLMIKLFESSIKLFYAKNLTVTFGNIIGQSSFISFATRTERPLLKLKRSVLLVMYNWLNGFYRVMNGKYSITLLFFGSNTRRVSLLRPRPSTVSIASAVQRN